MGSERLISAIERLDRALTRIETTIGAPNRPPIVDPAHDKLAERHRILRGQVEAAIARIDTLIVSAEG